MICFGASKHNVWHVLAVWCVLGRRRRDTPQSFWITLAFCLCFDIKEIVQPKNENREIIYSRSCCSKVVCLCFIRGAQKEFWRIFTALFHKPVNSKKYHKNIPYILCTQKFFLWIILFTKDALNSSKLMTVKTFIKLQKISISNALLNFLIIKKSWNDKCHTSHKKYETKLNIDNKEIFLEKQWFLKDHVTLKTGVMMLKIQLWSQE